MPTNTGRKGQARERVIAAALELFLRHGVSGISLQMIADELGVTKAAVYHQFASKDDIVRAVIAPSLESMAAVATRAEQHADPVTAFEVALSGLVDMVLEQRGSAAAMGDPVAVELLKDDADYRSAIGRIDRLLIGEHPDAEARAALALAGGCLVASGTDATLAGLPADFLRPVLLRAVRGILLGSRPHPVE